MGSRPVRLRRWPGGWAFSGAWANGTGGQAQEPAANSFCCRLSIIPGKMVLLEIGARRVHQFRLVDSVASTQAVFQVFHGLFRTLPEPMEALDYPAHSAQGGLDAYAGTHIPVKPCYAVLSSFRKASPCLSSSGSTVPMRNVRLLWRRLAGPTGTSVRVANAASMGWSMAGGSGAISAVPAAIRALSRPGRSCRPPSCR